MGAVAAGFVLMHEQLDAGQAARLVPERAIAEREPAEHGLRHLRQACKKRRLS